MNIQEMFERRIQPYVTEPRGISELAETFRKACLDMAIAGIPNIFEGFSFQKTYFYDIPCETDLKEMAFNMGIILTEDFWKEFSAFLFCKAMCCHKDTRTDWINMEFLDSHVKAKLDVLNQYFYLHVGKYYVKHYFRWEWEELIWDTKQARERYISILKTHAAIHDLWYAGGYLKNADLEIYFHIMKLMQLGMKDIEVSAFLEDLKINGWIIPENVSGNNWINFKGYMFGKELITPEDLLKCFSAKLQNSGDAEPILRFIMAVIPEKN